MEIEERERRKKNSQPEAWLAWLLEIMVIDNSICSVSPVVEVI